MYYKRPMQIRIIIKLILFLLQVSIIKTSEQGDYIVWDKGSDTLLQRQDIYTFKQCVIPSYFAHETDIDRLSIDTVETVYHPIDWSKYTLTEGTLEKDSPVAGKRDRYKLIPADQRLMPLYFEYQEESSVFQAPWLPKLTVFFLQHLSTIGA